jgi:hypothetical protein
MPEKGQEPDVYARNTSFLRLFLRNLEIPEDQWEALDPDDMIGLDCVIVVRPQKNNPEYMQVTKITRQKGTPAQSSDGNLDFSALGSSVPDDGGASF